MEPIRNRPPLGDIFCPPTQLLNDENEYLCRVGLIILISGSPSPGLPRLIATNLAAIYGGRQSDYMVNQATIAPYLITCPNTRIRDAIVQRGIHSIPSMRTQFAVHEWRPRFGMGHDPPTHQIWVKITGLPLQAWTTPQITAVIQKFGHPIQILPYGQAAGHYRDITALVATQNPNRIPMAYTYREGDYSARIDLLFLSWRLAQPGYFPPPDRPQARQNPHNFPQQNNQAATSQRHSSSSSSEVPSEPTVDLSSWSPRSHSADPSSALKWIAKPANKCQLPRPQLDNPTYSIMLSDFTLKSYNLTGKQGFLKLFAPNFNRDVAIADQIAHPNPNKIYPLMSVSLLIIPSQIAITPLFTLTTVCVRNWGEAHDKLINAPRSTPPALKYGEDKSTTVGVLMAIYPTVHPKVYPNRGHGLLQSTEIAQNICSAPSLQAHETTLPCQPVEAHTSQPLLSGPGPNLYSQPASPLPQADASPSRDPRPHSKPASLLLQAGTSSSSLCLLPPTSPDSQNTIDFSEICSQPPASPMPVSEQIVSSPSLPSVPTQSQRTTQQATRRSRRLQARRQPGCIVSTSLAKPKSRTAKMTFDIDSDLAPLDANKTLQILQATALQITEQVQKLIDEAIKQDQLTEIGGPSAPSTPLHDHIPPLAIPGEDLLL